jgi:DNA repair exonuclease SbcCD ATPase subunit
LSGSESALVEVAVRLAFIKYSQTAGADILLLDECFSSFDKVNLSNSSKLYDYIRDHIGQCLVITHQETIKGEFDRYTEIYKEDGFSYLSFP